MKLKIIAVFSIFVFVSCYSYKEQFKMIAEKTNKQECYPNSELMLFPELSYNSWLLSY